MRSYHCNTKLAPAGILAILLLCPSMQATTIKLIGNFNWSYQGVSVGPYLATMDGGPDISVFCMDLHLATGVNTTYSGSLSTPSTQAEEEAAFLASYSLYLGAPSSNLATINNVEGPISMAIWQLMGTLGATKPDPAALPYLRLAESAYFNHQISAAFLADVTIWTPDRAGSQQRFVTAYRDDPMFQGAVPEPGTARYMGSGLLAAIGGLAIRRRSPT